MADSESNHPEQVPADLDARIRSLEQYVAAQGSPGASGSSQWRSIHFAGGTIVHIHGIGSFELLSPQAIRGGIVGTAITLVLVLIFWLCFRRTRRT
jgi:hypothetical protein